MEDMISCFEEMQASKLIVMVQKATWASNNY